VLPGSASWCESDGTVTNSERRVQRVRKALDPPGGARDDISILLDLAARLGHEWTYGDHEEIWDELRRLSPMHAGMSWSRLEELGGIQWPCYSEDGLEPPFLHGRLWADDPAERGRPAPFSVVVDDGPVESLSDEYPLRLTTGRRLDSYNTGVQSGGYRSPNRLGETLDISPADAARLGIADGDVNRLTIEATDPKSGTAEFKAAAVRVERIPADVTA
jgi:predicted molibdopterin-dependent oxidoreductase YjgC